MKKNIIIIVSLIVIMGVLIGVLFFIKTDDSSNLYTKDEINFKDEYEKLNGYAVSEDYILKSIDIETDNNVKYVSDNEIIDLMKNGTNIIYFGWADCNWCRTLIPVLLEVLKENKIDTLYYYDFKSLRNSYENKDEEKSKIYEEIINIIGDDISTTFDENSARSGEKKILAPTVVFIKNNSYVGLHFKTVDSQKKSTDDLNKGQIQELKNKLQEKIDLINNNVCTTDDGC